MGRVQPNETLLRSMIQGVLEAFIEEGNAFTAYGVVLALRGIYPNHEIITGNGRTDPDFDGATVGPILLEIMTSEYSEEWTNRMMLAQDGNLATHWILKANDPQFDWSSVEDEEEEYTPFDDDYYGDDEDGWDDDDDEDDDDESLWDNDPLIDNSKSPLEEHIAWFGQTEEEEQEDEVQIDVTRIRGNRTDAQNIMRNILFGDNDKE